MGYFYLSERQVNLILDDIENYYGFNVALAVENGLAYGDVSYTYSDMWLAAEDYDYWFYQKARLWSKKY